MASINSHAKDLSLFWKGRILWDIPMAQYSTLKVGGRAEAVISVSGIEDLKSLLLWLNAHDICWWIVGKGSNILVPDRGLAGVIIILEGEFNSIKKLTGASQSPQETILIRAGGGCSLPRLVSFCTSQCLTGLEFAVGIPGSIGGAVVMNAGAWGDEIGTVVESAILMNRDGAVFSEPGTRLGFSYRKWGMPRGTVLLSATFALTTGDKSEIKAACKRYQELRLKSQPAAEHSAGSFFKNPPHASAGRLIEEAGLKGFSVGGAKISEKHANFIVNTGKASATDILKLMEIVQQKVYKHSGIRLEPEVHILEGNTS